MLRGSFDRASGLAPLRAITAFATETPSVLRQLAVDGERNETPAVPPPQKLLDLLGSIVTFFGEIRRQHSAEPSEVDTDTDF
ncbi:MAG: hypothetical protein AAFX06_14200 [Planctomycetota bacterium]